MSSSDHKQPSSELEHLTSSIREMANRVNAEFIADSQKTENYLAASRPAQPVQGSENAVPQSER
jgi:hypothetical protein